jgi:hypothetical protein
MFATALALLSGVVACRSRQAATLDSPARSSVDSGVKRAEVTPRRWDVETSAPVLEASTSTRRGWSGFHADADGSVWRFKHASAPVDRGECDVRSLARGTREFWRCFYAESTFLLQLSPEETAGLLSAASETVDGPRVGRGRVDPDSGGDLALSLTGFGTREGRPIVLGRCMARDQLASPAAANLFGVYRRIVRAEPSLGVDNDACQMPTDGVEIAPGVRAWFAH